VLLPKTGSEIGRLAVPLGAGIPEGGRLASATPSDERLADLRRPAAGLDEDTLIASGFKNPGDDGGGPRPRTWC